MSGASAIDLFLQHLPEGLRPRFQAAPELAGTLAEVFTSASAPWPQLRLTPAVFLPFLARRLPVDLGGPKDLSRLRLDDLYVLCAYAKGDPRAVVALERQYLEKVDFGLRRLGVPPTLIEDLRQVIHQRLLSSEQQDAWHLRYSGRGSLVRWLYVVATRLAVDVLRRDGRLVAIEDAHLEGSVLGDDHETAYLKLHYRTAFKEAFQAAFATLSHRDRNVLRYNILERLNIEQIGAIYQVHRATVARWIAGARQQLLVKTRAHMLQRINAGSSTFESVMRLIESELDASVCRLLQDQAAKGSTP